MRGVGGLNGWRWIFIIVNTFTSISRHGTANVSLKEGLLTVVVSIAGYFFVYNYPATAGFLAPKEKEFIITRLNEDGDASRDEKFTWAGVTRALKDPKVWLYGLAFHTMSLPLYTLSLFLPTIIKDLGYSAAEAQLLSTPPYVAAFIFTMSAAVFAEKTRLRAPFIIGGSSLAIVGYIILITSNRSGVSYAGTIIAASGIYSATAVVLSWPANNVSGQTKRATANGMQISIGNLGAIMGTQLYRPIWSPRYFVGHSMVRLFAIHILLIQTAR